jgi:hypothetical protein
LADRRPQKLLDWYDHSWLASLVLKQLKNSLLKKKRGQLSRKGKQAKLKVAPLLIKAVLKYMYKV